MSLEHRLLRRWVHRCLVTAASLIHEVCWLVSHVALILLVYSAHKVALIGLVRAHQRVHRSLISPESAQIHHFALVGQHTSIAEQMTSPVRIWHVVTTWTSYGESLL